MLMPMCLLLSLLPLGVAESEEVRMKQEFKRFAQLTEKWFTEGKKLHLKKAYKAAKVLVPYLVRLPAFPEGLDPLDVAQQIIGVAQKPAHLRIGIPLITAALEKYMVGGQPFAKRCDDDDFRLRRSCQDAHVLLCSALAQTDQAEKAEEWVAAYNRPRPNERQFNGAAKVHRQLPGINARPWLSAVELPPAYAVLQEIKSHFSTFKAEVLGKASSLPWDPLKNDPRLTVNDRWDPRSSWDAIPLFWDGAWVKANCKLLPETCAVLKRHSRQLQPLFDKQAFARLTERLQAQGSGLGSARVPPLSVQGYDEVPTLGIKLYRIWPQSGLKPHTGSPGRIVNSMALHAPVGSSLTVAGESQPWVEGEMRHFDDAFVHAVSNPHATEHRVVMAIVTWHPDLLSPGDADVGAGTADAAAGRAEL